MASGGWKSSHSSDGFSVAGSDPGERGVSDAVPGSAGQGPALSSLHPTAPCASPSCAAWRGVPAAPLRAFPRVTLGRGVHPCKMGTIPDVIGLR